ncbi:MAG TPA: glycerate kinase [Micromonosporaceae bacterium]
MSHVLNAPDKFKGSLTATEVAEAVARGIRRVAPSIEVRISPVADGGEGTLDAALAVGFRRVEVRVSGPTGAPVVAAIAVRGPAAVVELAAASGLALLPGGRPAPLAASSRGTGELIRAALDAGCTDIVLGVGGSASTDGGAGMLEALGVRLLGAQPSPGGAALTGLERIDRTGLDRRLAGIRLTLASDVANPLLGPEGAARIYGPQKGASAADVEALERGLSRWAAVVAPEDAERPGAGAAGGVGFAALSVLGARFRSGADVVLDLIGFDEHLAGARLVVTGEGALDEQTAYGKAPAVVARRANAAGVPVVAVCGRSTLAPEAAGFRRVYALSDLEPDPQRSMAHAAGLVEQVGSRIAADWPG